MGMLDIWNCKFSFYCRAMYSQIIHLICHSLFRVAPFYPLFASNMLKQSQFKWHSEHFPLLLCSAWSFTYFTVTFTHSHTCTYIQTLVGPLHGLRFPPQRMAIKWLQKRKQPMAQTHTMKMLAIHTNAKSEPTKCLVGRRSSLVILWLTVLSWA